MKVNRILFREMGEYNDMTLRPFHADFDTKKIDTLVDATDGRLHLTTASLAGYAVGMMRPASESRGVVKIASGWAERRLMFLMEVELTSTQSVITTEVISGYTDYTGVSALDSRSVKIDPKMRLYFNSVFNVKRMLAYGARGNEWAGKIINSAQVLTRNKVSNLSRVSEHGTLTMRPEDVLARSNVSREWSDIARNEGFRDTRQEFGRGALKLSTRGHTQSANYLSSTLTALRDAEGGVDFLEDDTTEVMTNARAAVRNRLINNDPVFEQIARDSAIMADGFITWEDLCSMNPNIDQIADVFFADKRTPTSRRSDSEQWGGSDNETLAATIVSNTIPAFLIDAMYADVEFTCTNDTRGGLYETRVARLNPFIPQTDVQENFNLLVSRIEHELMPEILFNTMMTVFLRVKCSLYGDTVIDIAFDNAPEARFVFPSFCDSVTSPIVTDSAEVVDTMAYDVKEIGRLLRERSNQSTGTPKIYTGAHI